MGGWLLWLLGIFLVLYPLAAPWRRAYIIGWLALWFSLWAVFFIRLEHESLHIIKGVLSGSVAIGAAIFIFTISSLVRIIFRVVMHWLVRST